MRTGVFISYLNLAGSMLFQASWWQGITEKHINPKTNPFRGGIRMSDSITFLGTAGDPIVVGKQIRASGGVALNIEGNQFFLDPGPGCLVRAKQANIPIRDTIAIFATNNQIVTAGDLNAAVDALTVSGLDIMGVVVAPKKVVHGDDNNTPLLSRQCAKYVERVIELEPDRKISINNINIIPTKTTFHADDCIGFIFETQKYRLGYTGDTDFGDELAEQYKNCDILIINVKNPRDVREEGALNTDTAIQFLRKAKPGKAVMTHFGIKMLQADPLVEARHIQRETKVDVIAATDGLIVNPGAFAAKMKQVSLDNFEK